MDNRIGRLLVEANEISQYLKRDYIFSADKAGDANNSAFVRVVSKDLRVDSQLSVSVFKDKLITLRKLMYEDPSKVSLLEPDEVIREACLQTKTETNEVDEKKQLNLNNCSSIPDTKSDGNISKGTSPRRNIEEIKADVQSREKYVDIINNNFVPKENVPNKTLSNGKFCEPKMNLGDVTAEDQWRPKELPRKKSLRKVQTIQEQLTNSACGQNISFCEGNTNVGPCSESGLHLFFKVCGTATSVIEKELQENQYETHFCIKSLQSCNNLLKIVKYFKRTHFEKLTAELEINCIQAISNLQLLSFTLPFIVHSLKEVEGQNTTAESHSLELLNSIQILVCHFAEFWKALFDNNPTLIERVNSLSELLSTVIENLGNASIHLNFSCPRLNKIITEVKQQFINGCDRAMFSRIETNLMIISQCYTHLECEMNEEKDFDMNKIRVTLLNNVFQLVSLMRQLLITIKQIQDELRSIESIEKPDNFLDLLYNQDVNIFESSTKLMSHVETLTKSFLLIIPATDITILTLKRVSKSVSQVEEVSKCLTSSYVQDDEIQTTPMTQEQLEALSELQCMIDACCMGLRSLLLDGISLGMNDMNNKSDISSPLPTNHSVSSVFNRAIPKRILPATPRDQLKQMNQSTPLISDNRVFGQISRSPPFQTIERTKPNQKHMGFDKTERISAFERIEPKNIRTLDTGETNKMLNLEKLDEKEILRGSTSLNNSNNFTVLRRNSGALRYYAHRHSFMQ